MAARLEAALLLLLLLGGVLPPTRSCPGTPGAGAGASPEPLPGTPGPAVLGALLRSLQRTSGCSLPSRPGFPGGRGSLARLSPRSWDPPTAPFWTMATPQRFGRRR
uniref:Uncharacterized protein n=1 Tax=Anas platyrhynchos TaxID=8839 RepID=A0A8B9STH3_ANAPL